MAQIAIEAAAYANKSVAPNKNVVPIGGGGVPGHLLRMIVMICTGGFAYPNTFVEGMDLTAIQKSHLDPADNSFNGV
jgi:hypothetical protein